MSLSVICDRPSYRKGPRFSASRSCLLERPSSRLGKLMRAGELEQVLELCEEYTPGNPPEYFFDRNPDNFPTILNIYR